MVSRDLEAVVMPRGGGSVRTTINGRKQWSPRALPRDVGLRRLVEVEVGLHDHLVGIAVEVEAELLADALHGVVLEEDVGGYAPQLLGAADLEELAQEQGTEAPALGEVGDEDGELRLVGGAAAAAEAGGAPGHRAPPLGVSAVVAEGASPRG